MPSAVSRNDIGLRWRHAYLGMRHATARFAKRLGNKAFRKEHHAVHRLRSRRPAMTELIGSHNGLHSEQGSRPGEHPGRSANPVIKVHDVVWLEFEKPDLKKAEAFA